MRLVASAFVAVLVTLILFYFMLSMVSNTGRHLAKPESQAGIRLVQVDQIKLTTFSIPDRRLLPSQPLSTVPASVMPAMMLDASVEPALPPPYAAMPELPPVTPGGKPYLGTYLKKTNKKTLPPPSAEVIATQPYPKIDQVQQSKKATSFPVVRSITTATLSTPESASTGGSDLSSLPSVGGAAMIAGSMADDEVVALVKIAPKYPRKAARSGKEGWVKIEFTITEQGTVVDPKVILAKPRRIFDRAALKAIRQWRFNPKTIDGKPVSRRAVQIIEFKLATG